MKTRTPKKPDERTRQAARIAVHTALASGRLKRRPCEVCGQKESVHAHHVDYAKPLKVRWLCPRHHMAEHPREGVRPWTTKEIAWMRKHGHLGLRTVAEELGRSPESVRQAASRNGISLRRKGSRRGAVLGQPRGVSLRQDIREDLVSGRIDPALVAERMRIDADAELCPSCAMRPIVVADVGLCRVCHLRKLAQAHRDALRELEAQRELWKSRKDLQRARDSAEREGWWSRERGVVEEAALPVEV